MTADQLPELLLVDSPTPMGRMLMSLMTDFRRRFLQYCRKHGHTKIRGAHTGILAHISPYSINLKTLAERSVVSQQAAGKISRELARMGYVDMCVNPSDRRETLIRLSQKGEMLKEDLQKINEEVRCDYRALLGDVALENFEAQLSLVLQILEKSDVENSSVKAASSVELPS